MTVLFIVLLLLGACAEKPASSVPSAQDQPNETQANDPEPDEMSHTDTPNLSLASVSQEYIDNIEQLERDNPDARIAQYDKGLNLKLLRNGEIRWYRFRLNPEYDVAEGVNGSLYYDEVSNNFYTGRWGEEISNILYLVDPDHQEHYLSGEEKIDDEKALYVGSLDPLQRIYYHPEFKKLYVMRLSLTNPQSYVSREKREENGETHIIAVTNKLTSPVYPVIKLNFRYREVYFANDQGLFYIGISVDGDFIIYLLSPELQKNIRDLDEHEAHRP